MAKLYTCSAVDDLAEMYVDADGILTTIEEGCLGWGLTVMEAPGYKCAVVTEVALNEWSSAHKVRFYNELPKKYQRMIDEL